MPSVYGEPSSNSRFRTMSPSEPEPEAGGPSFWEKNLGSMLATAAGIGLSASVDPFVPGLGTALAAVASPAIKMGTDAGYGNEPDYTQAAVEAGTGLLAGGAKYGGSELKGYMQGMDDIPTPDMYVDPPGAGSQFGGLDPNSSEYFDQVVNNQFRDSQAAYQKTIDDAGRQVVNSNQVIRDMKLDPWPDVNLSQGTMERGQGLLANNPPLQPRPVAIGGEINYPKSTQEFQRLNPEWQNRESNWDKIPGPSGPYPPSAYGVNPPPMRGYPVEDPRGYQMHDPYQFDYRKEYNVNDPIGFQIY